MKANKDFKRFKRWCKLKGLKPGNATSLQLYMKKKNIKEKEEVWYDQKTLEDSQKVYSVIIQKRRKNNAWH